MSLKKITLSIIVMLVVAGSAAAFGPPEPGTGSNVQEPESRLTTPLRSTMDRTFVDSPNYYKGPEPPPGYAEMVARLKLLYGEDVLDPGEAGAPPDDEGDTSSGSLAHNGERCSPCIERQGFNWDTSEPDVEKMIGFLYPRNATNHYDLDFTIYFEREIDIEPTDDIIEFIIEPYDNGTQNHLWVAFFDEGVWLTSNPSSCPIQNIDVVQSTTTVHEYYLEIKDNGSYIIGIKNTLTGDWQRITCNDSDDAGDYIGAYHASAELHADDLTEDFYAWARIRDDWTWVAANDSRRPKDTFNVGTFSSGPHTAVTYYYDSSKRSNTQHSASD